MPRLSLPMLLAVLTVLCLGALSAGAGGAQESKPVLTVTEKDSGKTFTLKVGDVFRLDLRRPGATGYLLLEPEFDRRVLKLLRHREEPPPYAAETRVGRPIRHLYDFQVAAQGTSHLVLKIQRPWEKDQPAREILKVTIISQGGKG